MTRLTTAPLDYQRVAEAFVHPLKLRILTLMAQPPPPQAEEGTRGCSPHGLAIALDEPLGTVSYHIHQLEKAGLIELVAVKPRRGALEHYYTLA